LKALATLLEEEIIDDDGNVTRRKVEPLLKDGVISWDVNWDIPEEWHDEARAILIEWNRLRPKMRRLLIHAWFAEEAWLG
jgi:capsid protein